MSNKINEYDDICSVRHLIEELIEYVRDKSDEYPVSEITVIFDYITMSLNTILMDYNHLLDDVYENINFGIWEDIDRVMYNGLGNEEPKDMYDTGYLDGLKRAKWFLQTFDEQIAEEAIKPKRREQFSSVVDNWGKENNPAYDQFMQEFLAKKLNKHFDDYVGTIAQQKIDKFVHDLHESLYNYEPMKIHVDDYMSDDPVELTPEKYKDYCKNCCNCISKDNT